MLPNPSERLKDIFNTGVHNEIIKKYDDLYQKYCVLQDKYLNLQDKYLNLQDEYIKLTKYVFGDNEVKTNKIKID